MVKSTDDIELIGKSARYSESFNLSRSGYPFTYDAWGKQRAPRNADLLRCYSRHAFTCANLNVNGVLNAKLRLYSIGSAKTTKGFANVKSVRLEKSQLSKLRKKVSLGQQDNVDEVLEHPFLNLWENPNPKTDSVEFLKLYQTYLEVLGNAYVKIIPDKLGHIQEWWVLPSHCVRPRLDSKSRQVIGFDYDGATYPPEFSGPAVPYVLAFCLTNPHDPYGGTGLSPLAAAFESVNLESKMMATEAAILDNEGRPSGILSPEEPIGDDEAMRWETRFNAKFRKAGSGNVMVTGEAFEFTPLTFPPKDLAALEISKATKGEIAQAFGIPAALLETAQFNRATLEASILQHVRQAIWPRLTDLEAKLNKHILPLFGPNLFVAFDDPSPESQDIVANYLRTLVDGGIITPNEARFELDYKPSTDGDTLRGLPGTFAPTGAKTGIKDPEDGTAPTEAPEGQQGAAPTEDVQAQAFNGAQVQSLVEIATQVAEGLLPAATASAIIAAAFPALSAEQIQAIITPIENFEPAKPEVPEGPQPGSPVPEKGPEPAPEQGKLLILDSVETKAQKWKAPPESPELEKVVQDYFAKFRASALSQVKKDLGGKIERKAFVPLSRARDELADKSQPIIEILLSEGGKELLQRVGVDPDIFAVTNPLVQAAAKSAAFAFADSTNQSTTKQLNDALASLRESLGEGLSEGDRLSEITKRVNEIFDGLSTSHAKMIAQTEASRAHHEGLRQAAKESGVVKGFELILSSDACSLCKQVAKDKKRIGLDDFFLKDESAPEAYQDRFVPIHVGCRCAVSEVLDIQA